VARIALVIWRCDDCSVEHVETPKGPPRDWYWFRDPTARELKHRCPECAAKAPPDNKGLPLGVESAFVPRKKG
jgi:hypothetical protein